MKKRTITEGSESVHRGHADDKGKQVVHKRVQGLVHELFPRHVADRLLLVVDVELGGHHEET